MDITVYLPDEIGKKAKGAGLNLSRILRNAVEEEIEKMEHQAAVLDEMEVEEITVELLDDDERPYFGKFRGSLVHETEQLAVYRLENSDILVYDSEEQDYAKFEHDDRPDDVAEYLLVRGCDGADFLEIMHELNIKPTVQI